MTRYLTRGAALACVATLAVVSSACGGVTRFEDTTPIKLASPVPPPEPPPPEPPRVEVKQDRIQINEKIQFAFNEAEILPASDSLLREVAEVLNQHTELKKIGIQGHTDSEGEPEYNQDLSERRAQAVLNWLKNHGIDAARMQSKGFGESQPIADNATSEGREKNRRVEFLIIEQEGAQ